MKNDHGCMGSGEASDHCELSLLGGAVRLQTHVLLKRSHVLNRRINNRHPPYAQSKKSPGALCDSLMSYNNHETTCVHCTHVHDGVDVGLQLGARAIAVERRRWRCGSLASSATVTVHYDCHCAVRATVLHGVKEARWQNLKATSR